MLCAIQRAATKNSQTRTHDRRYVFTLSLSAHDEFISSFPLTHSYCMPFHKSLNALYTNLIRNLCPYRGVCAILQKKGQYVLSLITLLLLMQLLVLTSCYKSGLCRLYVHLMQNLCSALGCKVSVAIEYTSGCRRRLRICRALWTENKYTYKQSWGNWVSTITTPLCDTQTWPWGRARTQKISTNDPKQIVIKMYFVN